MKQERVSDTDWKLTNGRGYILNRDRGHAAAARLKPQFYLWKTALQFNIHRSIKSLLSRTANIVHVASGNAIWLINVASELPEEIPDDLVGNYDYVYTRLLMLVVESKYPRPIIRNLGKLLKPGGHLQWDELDTVNISIKKVYPDLPTPGLDGSETLFAFLYLHGERPGRLEEDKASCPAFLADNTTDTTTDALPKTLQ